MDHASFAGELDAQELLHLALKAMSEQRDAEAISLLKRGVAIAPEDGRLHYLLGAMHAQLGMYERAVDELRRAVELAPEIDMAHFQFGLLLLTRGDVDGARNAWQPLDRLDAEHPLALFRSGLSKLILDDFDGCIADLRRGIVLNGEDDPLSRDMRRMADAAEQARAGRGGSDGGNVAPAAGGNGAGAQHVLLAGYRSPGTPER